MKNFYINDRTGGIPVADLKQYVCEISAESKDGTTISSEWYTFDDISEFEKICENNFEETAEKDHHHWAYLYKKSDFIFGNENTNSDVEIPTHIDCKQLYDELR